MKKVYVNIYIDKGPHNLITTMHRFKRLKIYVLIIFPK